MAGQRQRVAVDDSGNDGHPQPDAEHIAEFQPLSIPLLFNDEVAFSVCQCYCVCADGVPDPVCHFIGDTFQQCVKKCACVEYTCHNANAIRDCLDHGFAEYYRKYHAHKELYSERLVFFINFGICYSIDVYLTQC